MNYREFKEIQKEDFPIIAYIPDFIKLKPPFYMRPDYRALFIYRFIFDDKGDKAIVSVGKNGTKELFDIKTLDDNDYLCYVNNNGEEEKIDLKLAIPNFIVIGKIEDQHIFSEFFRQGYIYKNELIFFKTLNLSDEEIDKLPLEDKICYISEADFVGNSYIDITKKNLIEGEDYHTVKSIRRNIEEQYGEKIVSQISDKDMKTMIEDVFYAADWQSPTTLLEAEEYLDDFIEEQLGITLDSEFEGDNCSYGK